VTTDFGSDAEAFALAIDSKGRIVAAGWSGRQDFYDFTLARYNANGSLDTNFGNNGKVITDFSGYNDLAYALTVDSGGKIVLAGTASQNDFAVARYNANGSLDINFGTNGKVTTDFGGYYDEALAIAIDSSGKIVVAGTASGIDFALARYVAEIDTTPPTPNPMTWETVPYQTGISSISMVATTATDSTPPISYYLTLWVAPLED